ncbi:MAG: M20/M25/M40 family metallo-hydrolase, partial [Beijerinckiaceae bacterium]|nr:M20/M25/M40 family metallo-hydrolase [Beijerinckiaceae bacterium]
ARSPELSFATQIVDGFEAAFAKAKAAVTDHEGATAEVVFKRAAAYPPFRLDQDAPVVKRATRALGILGIEPTYIFSNGGLDANWLDRAGVPTITIGAGQAEIHTIKEFVKLDEYEKGCRLGILMATLED